MPHQGVRPLRNGRLGKARAAFGGCNDKLCNGGHRGDSWDSGLVRSEPDAADSELGLAVGIFGAVKSSGRLGPRLQRVSVAIALSAITLGARRDAWERVGDFQLQQPSRRLGLGSAAPRRRCDDWITEPRSPANAERQVVSRQGATDAGECRISLVARGRGTDGEVGRAGVRRVQRELDSVTTGTRREAASGSAPCAGSLASRPLGHHV